MKFDLFSFYWTSGGGWAVWFLGWVNPGCIHSAILGVRRTSKFRHEIGPGTYPRELFVILFGREFRLHKEVDDIPS